MKYFLSLFIVFISFSLNAGSFKKNCNSTELKLKSCYLKYKNYTLQVKKENINLFDGVWRAITKQKLSDEESQWLKVSIRSINKRLFLDMKIWDKPRGEAHISSLNWLVYEIHGAQLTERIFQVIRKKRITDKGKEYKDPYEKFGIKVKKNKFYWRAGHHKGSF